MSTARIEAALRRGGRERNLQVTEKPIQTGLRSEQLAAHPGIVEACTASAGALVAVLITLTEQVESLRDR